MMAANADLQYLGAANEENLTSVMSINQRGREEETGDIKLNLFVISAKSYTNREQLRMASGNLRVESLKHDGQRRKSGPSMGDYKLLQAEKILGKGRRLP